MEKYELPYYSETILKNSAKLKQYQEYEKLPLEELFNEYHKVTGPEGAIVDRKKHEVLLGVIADKLQVFPREVLERVLWEELGSLIKQFNELESQFKSHRHCLDKTYGEKPVW